MWPTYSIAYTFQVGFTKGRVAINVQNGNTHHAPEGPNQPNASAMIPDVAGSPKATKRSLQSNLPRLTRFPLTTKRKVFNAVKLTMIACTSMNSFTKNPNALQTGSGGKERVRSM